MRINPKSAVALALRVSLGLAFVATTMPLPGFAEDLYKGSAPEREFAEKLRASSNASLLGHGMALQTDMAFWCSTSAVLVGGSAVLETVPIAGFIPKLATSHLLADDAKEEFIKDRDSGTNARRRVS